VHSAELVVAETWSELLRLQEEEADEIPQEPLEEADEILQEPLEEADESPQEPLEVAGEILQEPLEEVDGSHQEPASSDDPHVGQVVETCPAWEERPLAEE
jgi:phage repressor protein C with HTH and peptisase S24 domain